jgi:hypothetical protein
VTRNTKRKMEEDVASGPPKKLAKTDNRKKSGTEGRKDRAVGPTLVSD